jgi:hypothetical protein
MRSTGLCIEPISFLLTFRRKDFILARNGLLQKKESTLDGVPVQLKIHIPSAGCFFEQNLSHGALPTLVRIQQISLNQYR